MNQPVPPSEEEKYPRAKQMDFSTVFERYRPIIDDWEAFVSYIRKPLPTYIWVNRLRTNREKLMLALKSQGFQVSSSDWNPFMLEIDQENSSASYPLGSSWEFLSGQFHIQEASSTLPINILGPQPHERILDLCAAPGGKSAQIAVALKNTGSVIANDVNYSRMKAMRQIVERLGLHNLSATVHDATNFPGHANQYDRVLADVPCSCEGTSRKYKRVTEKKWKRLSQGRCLQQGAILRRAIQLCKDGGEVIYSTCTYSPEENEAIVQQSLDEFGSKLELIPIEVEGLDYRPGLTQWEGQHFSKEMSTCLRLWPHLNNTGGFFVAHLKKKTNKSKGSAIPNDRIQTSDIKQLAACEADRKQAIGLLEERYGIKKEILENLNWLRQGKEGLYVCPPDHLPPGNPKPDSIGLFLFRTALKFPKLTTAGAIFLAQHAKKNILQLPRSQASKYLAREDQKLDARLEKGLNGSGYVIIRHEELVLGTAFYRKSDEGSEASLVSLYPKAWSSSEIARRRMPKDKN